MDRADFGRKLAHLVTEQDRAASKRRGYNPYALGIMLGAAHECEAAVTAGERPEVAFAEHFTPTRENHTMARKLGLLLDVQHGQWIPTQPASYLQARDAGEVGVDTGACP